MFEVLKNAISGNTPFWVLTLVSIALIIASWIVPPVGQIDNSVIAAVGELAGFGALWCVAIAIDKGVGATVRHGNTEVAIDSNSNSNSNSDDDNIQPRGYTDSECDGR